MAFIYNQIPKQLINILDDMFQQQQYETLIIINDEPQQSLLPRPEMIYNYNDSATTFELIPKLLLNKDNNPQLNESNWNTKFLIVFKIPAEFSLNNFKILKTILDTQTKLSNIKIMALLSQTPAGVEKYILMKYFLYFQQLNLYDVLIVPIKSQNINIYYTYKAKPYLKILTKEFDTLKSTQYYIKQIDNLQQYPLLTYPDQTQPRTLLYYNKKGELEMLGYIGRLITTYSEKINASLKFAFPIEINSPLFFGDVYKMALNGSLDIAASIASVNEYRKMEYFSHFIELGKWFPMLPVADYLTRFDIYYSLILHDVCSIFLALLIIYSIFLFILELLHDTSKTLKSILFKSLINQKVFLGLLAASFKIDYNGKYYKSYRIFISLIQFSGFMLVIFTNTYLTSNITSAPKYQEINTFEQLHEQNLKILMLAQGLRSLKRHAGDDFLTKYKSSIITTTNMSELVELRNNLNKSLAYAITSNMWSIYEKQQLLFSEKLFRYSPQMYFNDHIIFALPLQKNSIFEKSLNHYIAQLMASGIFQYWYESSFFDMIKTGHMSFKDLSHAHKYEPGNYEDFAIVWYMFGFGLGLSFIVFIMELLVYKIKYYKK